MLILPLLALMPLAAHAEGDDEGALWTEIGIQKSVNKQWNVGLETEMREPNPHIFSERAF